MTYQELLREGKDLLEKAGVPDHMLDARLLLEYFGGITRSDLLAHGDSECPAKVCTEYREAISRRASRIPIQQITGTQNFMGLDFLVDENVLIPRQDTEVLVEGIMKDLPGETRILDLCTGSGCILISLMHYSNACHGVGVDLSTAALGIAKKNANALTQDEDVIFIQGDLWEGVTGEFDLLVSNPPYIPTYVVKTLMPEVRLHEPLMALDGKEDGLYFYRRILEGCGGHLAGGARAFFEIGADQGEAVSRLMEENGFYQVKIIKDYAGLDRVVCGYWKGKISDV